MAYTTFTPSREPTSIDIETEIKTLSNEFGDGYEQSIADGLNAERLTLSVVWENLTIEQYKAIDAFFSARYSEPFKFYVPLRGETRLFRCVKWSHSFHERFVDMTAEFKTVVA